MKTLKLIRSLPTILVVSVKYQLTRLVGTFLISSSWIYSPYLIEPVLNHYITEGTMRVRTFLISSSWFDSPVPYCTSIEPVYYRGSKASGDVSHQFELVRFDL